MNSRRSVLSGALVVLMMSWNFDYVSAKPAETPIKPSPETPPKICLTKSCVQTASKILDNLDETVDPCENFYRFACGGYQESITFPENYEGTYTEKEFNDNIFERVIKSLEKASPSNEPRPLKLVKELYRSCMNTSAIEKPRMESLLTILKEAGGWPTLEGDKWNEDGFNWLETIFKLSRMGYDVRNVPQIHIITDSENNNKQAIYFAMDLWLDQFAPTANLKDQNRVYENMIDITKELGANNSFARKEFTELHDFVQRLHDLESNKSDNFFYRMSLRDFDNIFTAPWKQHIKSLFPSSFNITDNEVVIVNSPKSIVSLAELMARTPKRVQANYLMWNIVSDFEPHLKTSISEEYTPKIKKMMRANECYQTTSLFMPVGLNALYVRNYFDKRPKKNAIEIMTNIRTQVHKTLQDTKSLNPAIKEHFINKIEKMSILVGYPDEFFNSTELEKLYQHLEIYPDDYIRNLFNLATFRKKNKFAELRKSTRGRDWQTSSSQYSMEWNSFFYPEDNTVIIPAAHLQDFMNKNDNPQYLKYGSVGTVIGHEIHHAFDSIGRNVDQDGNKFVWNDSNKNIFARRDQCFIDQYGKYSVGGKKLNGSTSLDENFADNGGIKMAYSAYLDWSSNRKESEFLLPGLERYNHRQMFWISAANFHCSTTANLNSYNDNDLHAPNKFRIIGSFSNMPEFAKDFNCLANSPMNPLKKCSVW